MEGGRLGGGWRVEGRGPDGERQPRRKAESGKLKLETGNLKQAPGKERKSGKWKAESEKLGAELSVVSCQWSVVRGPSVEGQKGKGNQGEKLKAEGGGRKITR
jgi:uncharacterized protein YndB with AHSA1/START domain